MNDSTKSAVRVAKELIFMTLATAKNNGEPWNSAVYTAYDEDMNFYWTSDKESQHSQNVRENERVFIVIYDACGSIEPVHGMYIQATARELSNLEEIRKARTYTQGRKGGKWEEPELFQGEHPRRVYKATPVKVWTNEAVYEMDTFIRDIRVELNINELKKLLQGAK